jgi:hypothetical protein
MPRCEEQVVLMIVDISGYPDFMLANAKSLGHSRLIVGERIQTILQQVELPLTPGQAGGDAIFLDAIKGAAFDTHSRTIGACIRHLFQVFSHKLGELTVASFCKRPGGLFRRPFAPRLAPLEMGTPGRPLGLIRSRRLGGPMDGRPSAGPPAR